MRGIGRVVAGLVLVAGLAATPGVALAQTPAPPPPNPSDGALQRSHDAVGDRAARAAALGTQLAGLDDRADELHLALTAQQEDADRALVDLQAAQGAAAAATTAAAAARTETTAAGSAIDAARDRLDGFLTARYQDGLDAGPLGLLTTAAGPQDLLDRAAFADTVAVEAQRALDGLERARVAKANADSRARAAQDEARARQGRAQQAKTTADGAVARVQVQARDLDRALAAVAVQRDDVSRQLAAAESADAGLRDQRARFLTWQEQQAAAQAARERAEQQAAAARLADRAVDPAPAQGVAGGVSEVIDRAMSALGVQYAWGGGTASGPSRGVRDGGVADSYGDYHRVGFDCSGLMVYAFGGVGVSLPHYSGYQYTSGRQVPVGQRQAGDMLFYAEDGTIGHVTLYLGGGRMIEAPYSGSAVRVVPVRTRGLMPYATRML